MVASSLSELVQSGSVAEEWVSAARARFGNGIETTSHN